MAARRKGGGAVKGIKGICGGSGQPRSEAKRSKRAAAEAKHSIPQLDRGVLVEVMKDFDTVLLFGVLAELGPAELSLRRVSGERDFPILEKGGIVLVRCYDEQMEPVLLRARVARSSREACSVGELEAIPYRTDRKHRRYPLCPPAVVCMGEEVDPGRRQPCQLLNLSAGGACVVTERVYPVGQALSLQIAPSAGDACTVYPCKVVRATPRRGGQFEYGLLFVCLSRRRRRCLTRELLTIQKKWKNSSFHGEAL